MLTEQEILFIQENLSKDPFQISLAAKKNADFSIPKLAFQIQARQKLKDKIPSWANNSAIFFPPSISLEQSSSELTSHFKAGLIKGKIIDITGGMGVDSWAFALAGNQVEYVEIQPKLCEITQYNHQVLINKNKQIKHHNTDGIQYLKEHYQKFDFVYLDPARRNEKGEKVILFKDCQPNVIEILPIIDQGLQLLLKTSPILDIDRAVKELGGVDAVYVVSIKNEVKELLFFKTKVATLFPIIHIIELNNSNPYIFSSSKVQEKESVIEYASALNYLYEAHAGIMKAGFFKNLAKTGVYKISQHTHLYTSDHLITDFPGKIFKIDQVGTAETKWIQQHLVDKKANIVCKNFPQSTAELRKKWKLQDGGNKTIYAYENKDGKNEVAICSKV
ncbi:class I SAM-dependent methyltransferase [Aquirufa sp. ROCK-SH2]